MKNTRMVEGMKKSRLFLGIEDADLESMLQCLDAQVITAQKGAFVLRAGDAVKHVGVVLEGQLSVVKENADADRSLLAQLGPGDHFAEALCCAGVMESPVSVVAQEDSAVLLLNFTRILHLCSKTCAFHAKLIENMLFIVANKNLQMQARMDYLGKKTLRKRVMTYLVNAAGGSDQPFTIPFNREELADYLCVDRSALSRELSHLKREGIIDYWKNQFKILRPPTP